MPDDWELPVLASDGERALAESLGPDGLQAIDDALIEVTQPQWLKAARVVGDAMKVGGFPTDDTWFDLHVRRVIALAEAGALESQGNLRRPRFSEVRLPSAHRK